MLLALQREFSSWLKTGEQGSADHMGVGAAAGLRIYRNNHRSSLFACLEETFIRTRQWIGDDAFRDAVSAHIERVPPSSWTLDAYPRDVPATLDALYPHDPEVAEIAAIELALAEAFVAPDADPLSVDVLVPIDWDSAVLTFTPSLDLLPMRTNSPDIWAALADGESPPAVTAPTVDAAVLVWRQEEISRMRSIDGAEHRALLMARAAIRFGDLCAALVEVSGDNESGVALTGKFLGQWLVDGLIVRIEGDETCAPQPL